MHVNITQVRQHPPARAQGKVLGVSPESAAMKSRSRTVPSAAPGPLNAKRRASVSCSCSLSPLSARSLLALLEECNPGPSKGRAAYSPRKLRNCLKWVAETCPGVPAPALRPLRQQASRQTARDAPDQRGNRVTGAYELDVGLLDDADLLRVDRECHREATRRLLRAGGHKVQRVVEGVTPVSPRRRGGAQLLGLRRPLCCSSKQQPSASDDSAMTLA